MKLVVDGFGAAAGLLMSAECVSYRLAQRVGERGRGKLVVGDGDVKVTVLGRSKGRGSRRWCRRDLHVLAKKSNPEQIRTDSYLKPFSKLCYDRLSDRVNKCLWETVEMAWRMVMVMYAFGLASLHLKMLKDSIE
ncbi:hypothetical protein PR202_ga21801 [Eleusine coracana subsp. coracana]|uniref:Uncharacterized protein n=1 Tax=Eleusine coracana subsp. coracana TaxID=191504 RepID=A0AAV5D2G2_ELECO|nr:hypothetical protein PR202_ga21801 [Eleusine coracana subsp. coracana]